jgi:hypothetical protein
MDEIRAFIAHSFTADDAEVVRKFTDYFDTISKLLPEFSWTHAEPAEPKQLPEKVMAGLAGCNTLIAICTRKEIVLNGPPIKRKLLNGYIVTKDQLTWKTSDWIVQEIGLGVGRKLGLILLIEEGVADPGGLQGGIEHIPFDRAHPEQAFDKILQMIRALLPTVVNPARVAQEAIAITAEQPEADAEQNFDDELTTPNPDWSRGQYEIGLMHALVLGKRDVAEQVDEAYLASEDAKHETNALTWKAFSQYRRILDGAGGSLSELERLTSEEPPCAEALSWLARAYRHYRNELKAALTFEKAAAAETITPQKIKLLGDAALSYRRSDETDKASSLFDVMRSLCSNTNSGEVELLRALRGVAEFDTNEELAVALLERIAELHPDDTNARFSAAYKHSQLGHDEICLYQYSAIPHPERERATWNNLGVIRDQLSLPIRSISSYRMAEEKGETLAISNIAKNF